MIDHDHKLIFIHIARTGGTSIETACVGYDWRDKDRATKHLSAKQTRELYGEEVWSEYTTFSVVRNPWDRVISLWKSNWYHQSIPRDNKNLADFIVQLEPHKNDKAKTLLCSETLNEKLDYTLQFDTLQQDFSNMLKEKNLADIILPHIQKRKRKQYPHYYNTKTQQMVADFFAKDIIEYNFNYEESAGGETKKDWYSQHGEDCLLWEFFINDSSVGFYIDVGAFDGRHLSNSYAFDDAMNGICVEPELEYFQMCDSARKGMCVNAACIGEPDLETVSFTIMEHGGLGSGVEVTEKKKNKGRFTYSSTEVPAVTLNKLLDECPTYHGRIDFLSVDVEGTEIDVLKGLDFTKHHPRVIIAEANNKRRRVKLDDYVINTLGYHLAGGISVNRFYVRDEEDVERIRSIDVSCNLKTAHPTQQNHTTDKDRAVQAKLKV